MPSSSPRSFHAHAGFLRRQFLQDGGLPFTDILTDEVIADALAGLGRWLDRIFSPLVTLWVFLGQVLSADHSCRAAVARLIAHRVARGQSRCSARTGAYCRARARLPEAFVAGVARRTGHALDDGVDPRWLWKGRRVYIYDGSTVSMPDTPANQAEYPQPVIQKPGVGFPLARIAAVFSLACGAVLDLRIRRYAGKGQSELGMLRDLWDLFRPGDVFLADRLMCSWTEMVLLQQRGVQTVTRVARRHADFRRGQRLGKDDHIVRWLKPKRPRTVDRVTYRALPEFLLVRECRVRVDQPGFRVKTVVIATTLLDAVEYPREDLARLYRARWHAELDVRSLKQALQMDILRCQTPELVRTELWMHVLAYNLIRTVMAQAATRSGVEPREVSFKGTVQTLEAFQPVLALRGEGDADFRRTTYENLLDAIASHRVADRPDRYEPRRKKRRPKAYDRLMKPRCEAKREMRNEVKEK